MTESIQKLSKTAELLYSKVIKIYGLREIT